MNYIHMQQSCRTNLRTAYKIREYTGSSVIFFLYSEAKGKDNSVCMKIKFQTHQCLADVIYCNHYIMIYLSPVASPVLYMVSVSYCFVLLQYCRTLIPYIRPIGSLLLRLEKQATE